jgi:hypothetical protein
METGAIVRLDGDKGDQLQVLVQDPLDTLTLITFTMKGQGHVEVV